MPRIFILPTCPIPYSFGLYWQGKYAAGTPLQILKYPNSTRAPCSRAPRWLGMYGALFSSSKHTPWSGCAPQFPSWLTAVYQRSDQFYAFPARGPEQRRWVAAWDQLEPLNTHLPSPSSAPLFSSRCGPPRLSPDVQPAAASSRHLEPPTRRTLQCNTGPRVHFAPLNPSRS